MLRRREQGHADAWWLPGGRSTALGLCLMGQAAHAAPPDHGGPAPATPQMC